MKTTILELEEQDGIITVQDRLNWVKSPRVVLVWPKDGQILTRKLDLVLLQRAARQRGLQMGLITRDPQVLEHAQELGIPVFRSQKQALQGVWRRKPQRLRLLRPRRNIPPPADELRKMRTERHSHPYPISWRIILFSIGLLSVLSLILFLVPAASITLPLAKTEQQMEISVWLSPGLSGITLAGGVPVSVESVVIEDEAEIPTTGNLLVADQRAQGEVVFTNLTDSEVNIPKGSVVLTDAPEPVRYMTTREANLAAGAGKTVTVRVEAQLAGTAGNTAKFTIRAVEGALGLQAAVNNPEPVTGGTEQMAAAPSAADEEILRRMLTERMAGKASEWLSAKSAEGVTTIQPSIKAVQVVLEEQFPQSGQPGSSLRLHLKIEYQGWVVRNEHLQSVASKMMDANLPQGVAGIDQTLLFTFGDEVQPEGEGLRWYLTARRQIAQAVNNEMIIEQVLGKSKIRALETLRGQVSLSGEPMILIAPDWWPWLPILPAQMRVVVQ